MYVTQEAKRGRFQAREERQQLAGVMYLCGRWRGRHEWLLGVVDAKRDAPDVQDDAKARGGFVAQIELELQWRNQEKEEKKQKQHRANLLKNTLTEKGKNGIIKALQERLIPFMVEEDTMMIGLIGAMAVEVEALAAQLENRRDTKIGMDTFMSGTLFGQEAVLAVCGPGKINAALCTQSMIMAYHPQWVLNLGVAGAGAEGVSIGDLVVATAAVQHDADTSPLGDPVGMVSKLNLVELPCDAALREKLTAAAKKAGLTVHEGIIATGDQFIHDGETRARIHQLFQAKAVEMEGGAVAHACYMHGVPCGVIRSISDQADGHSDMDYPSFTALAAAHSQKVVENLLRA